MEITVTSDRERGNETKALAYLASIEAVRQGSTTLFIDVTDDIFKFVFDHFEDRDERQHAMFVRVTNPDTGRMVKAVCSWEYDANNGIECIKFTVKR